MLLIDADSIVYSSCAVTHRTWYTLVDPNGFTALVVSHKRELKAFMSTLEDTEGYTVEEKEEYDPINYTYHIIDSMIESMIEKFPGPYKVIISDTTCNWRKDLYPDYKAHRPVNTLTTLPNAYEYIKTKWDAVWEECKEADDLLPKYGSEVQTPIYAHIDKDLDQLPGLHYNYKTKKKYTVSKEQGYKKFLELLMVGDTADNIMGLKGIGPKKAMSFINEHYNNPDVEDMIGFIYLLLSNPHYQVNKKLIRL